MYEALFSTKVLTITTALLLALLAGGIAGRPSLAWRGFMYGFGPMLAAAFFVVALVAPTPVDAWDAAAGLLLEFTVLCVYLSLLKALLETLRRVEGREAASLLRRSFVLQALLIALQLNSEGFGIFSEGSRIDYLYVGSLAKYLTYAGILLMAAQAALIAHRVSETGGPGWLGLAVIALAFATSVVAGSKGGVFLWILSILALIDYRRAKISWLAGVVALVALSTAFIASSIVVADFLGLDAQEFSDLLLGRIFLNNDARALAFDFRNSDTESVGLLRESFRSLATLLGAPPQNPALGVKLYEELLGGDTGGSGANAALSALILYYFPSGYAILPAAVASCGALLLAVFFKTMVRGLARASSRLLVLVFAMFAVQQYSQDFLAFQVVMPLVIVALAGIWLYERNGHPLRRRIHPAQRTLAQRHHPGA